jgi:hypothetical protein
MTITWCESARCSNTRSKRDRSAEVKGAKTLLTDEIIFGQQSVADLLETQQIPCGWNFWYGQASMRREIIASPACWFATIRSIQRFMDARTRGAVSQLIGLRQAPPYFP